MRRWIVACRRNVTVVLLLLLLRRASVTDIVGVDLGGELCVTRVRVTGGIVVVVIAVFIGVVFVDAVFVGA